VSSIDEEEVRVTIQPCLSTNISIMRNNDDASTEQPTVVTSGCRTDQRHPTDERGLLEFDLASLPEGYRIKEATLSLYVVAVYVWDTSYWKPVPELTRTIELHAITSDWKGWTFTYWTYATYPDQKWKVPGGDFAAATDFVTVEKTDTWNSWTVTGDVRAWYDGAKPNYGWLLKDAKEGDKVGYRVEYMNWFYYVDVSYSPKLEVILEKGSASLWKSEWVAGTVAGACAVIIIAIVGRGRLRR
jgi:hypothetical protein